MRLTECNSVQSLAAMEKVDLNKFCSSSSGSTGSFNLGDNQKRWLVTGICLNKILLPALRDFVKPEMLKHYTHLRTTHGIDKQVHAKHLSKDGKTKFNYASINLNEAKHKKRVHLYDYSVKSAVDLAKLYLQPFMAKFTGKNSTSVMEGRERGYGSSTFSFCNTRLYLVVRNSCEKLLRRLDLFG